MALTAKQKMFAQEYLVDLNATQAALRAGYSKKTAFSIGNENLKKPEIQAAIQKLMQKREKRVEINQDYVIEKLLEITEKQASDMPESDLKYGNKIKAIELLGKHFGAFECKEQKQEDDAVKVIIDV